MLSQKEEIIANREKLLKAINYTVSTKNNNDNTYVAIAYPILKDIRDDFVSLNDKGDGITYSKSTDKFDLKNRVPTTLGRYARRILKVDNTFVSDTVLDNFVKSIVSFSPTIKEKDLVFLKGQAITDFYKKTNIKSCMTKEEAYKTELYALNPDKVSLLVYKKVARALFWDFGKVKFLDRVYPVGSQDASVLIGWAAANNYAYRTEQGKIVGIDKDFRFVLKANKYIPYRDSVSIIGYNTKLKTLTCSLEPYHDDHFEYEEYDNVDNGYVPWLSVEGCFGCDYQYSLEELEKRKTYSGSEYFCKTCIDDLFNTCKFCKKEFYYNENDYDFYDNHESSYTCLSCTNKLFFACVNCDDLYLKKNQTKYKCSDYKDKGRGYFGYLCKSCAKRVIKPENIHK